MFKKQIIEMVKQLEVLGLGKYQLYSGPKYVVLFLANIPGFLGSFFLAITVLRRGPNFENVCENVKYKPQTNSILCQHQTLLDRNWC